MTRLVVSNFSCIKNSTLELGKITLLIGPQASGKSVLCKLNYFFIDMLQKQMQSIMDGLSFEDYLKVAKERFIQWFPISAWGVTPFSIEFKSGDCEIRLTRRSYRGVPSENIRVWASEPLREQYSAVIGLKNKLSKSAKANDDEIDFSLWFKIQESMQRSLYKLLEKDYYENQVFIPAGRSFFTSIGRAVSAFEHGKTLDPLTLNFGRMYAQMRDMGLQPLRKTHSRTSVLASALNEIFGGKLISKRNEEFVLSNDGRKIPISSLSSGQQELLPLITVLPKLLTARRTVHNMLIYIEEPEAHLFPAAQSKLIEALSSFVNVGGDQTSMVLTTHSPYVLSKVNNLIKANQVAVKAGGKYKDAVEKVIPNESQISKSSIRAYAILDGVLTDIQNKDGLIDAEYLDQVSCDISNEFDKLLAIEFQNG